LAPLFQKDQNGVVYSNKNFEGRSQAAMDDAYEDRRMVVLRYLRAPIELGAHSISVDVLDSDFVDYFIGATKSPHSVQPFGANKCPLLGSVLARMAREGSLTRTRAGVQNMAGMGFPTWVWLYELASHMIPKNEGKNHANGK
jgi:hypothetical protein